MPRKAKEEEKNTPKKTVKKDLPKKAVNKAKKDTTKVKKNSTTTVKSKNTKKSTSSKKTSKTINSKSKKNVNNISSIEYYDLPYRYNQTVVKILAQTPNTLFVYWDIADHDRMMFEDHYGNDFFSKTKPVLIVHNETMNYSFEIEINDFANSWYLHVNDANCKYEIELGRRPFVHTSTINEDYIYISSSNEIDAPNDHVLFEKFNPNVSFKNIKTGTTSKRDFSGLINYRNMNEIYSIYDLYKTIYKDDLFEQINSNNICSSSSMSSSNFK